MAEPSGIDGVSVSADFENPSLTPDERALLNLSEEELSKQIEKVAANPPPPVPVVEPARVETPESRQAQLPAAQQPPTMAAQPDTRIPEKFQKPDGTLDEAKLDKSLTAINAKLSDYLAAEKDMSRLRQQKPPQNIEPTAEAQQTGFIQRFKEDYAEHPEETILRLANAIEQGTKMSLMGEIEEIKGLLKLKELTESNPDMLNRDTLDGLKQIRAERPHLTWEDALDIHKGRTAMKNKGTADTAQPKPQAPILPGGISPSVQPASPSGVTLDKVNDLLRGKTSQEQEAILAKILPHK